MNALNILKKDDRHIKMIYLFYFTLITIYVAFKLNVFLSSDVLYSFRADNFWSFSSNIFRRGLSGELIYRLHLITGYGIYLFSILILIAFITFTAIFLKEIKSELSALEATLLILSPFLLLYSVDSEIFTLLPFLALLSKNKIVLNWLTPVLIIASVSFREFSMILYFPVFIYFITRGTLNIKIFHTLTLFFIIFIVFYPKPTPSFTLENTIWHELNLQSTSLYKFTEMTLKEVIPLHFNFIEDKWHYFIVSVVCFILLIASSFYSRTKSATGTLYLLATLSLCFVLTVDYGRYFYLFLFFYFIASKRSISCYFISFPRALNFIERIKLIEYIFLKIEQKKIFLLVIATFAPSGYWTGSYVLRPRFYTFLAENKYLFESFQYFFK